MNFLATIVVFLQFVSAEASSSVQNGPLSFTAIMDVSVDSFQPFPGQPLSSTLDLLNHSVQDAQYQRIDGAEEPTSTVLGLVVGLEFASICNVWTCMSAIVGVYLLVAGRHFSPLMCIALSLNFWCSTVWVTWAISSEIGLAVALMAVIERRSLLLFPKGGQSFSSDTGT